MIQTLEGAEPFCSGDYLARDTKGVWSIRSERMEQDYCWVGATDGGFALYQSFEVREACQMSAPFTAGGLHGKAGDYLVCSGESQWPVDRELFQRTYERVE